jgi:RNA polymerase sigma factor (sigma-70 family)
MPPQFSCVPLRSTSENCAVLPCFSDFGCFPTAHFLTFPECVNDAYLGAWNAIPPVRPNPLLSYIVKIVRNISLKIYWRKEAAKRSGHYTIALEEIEGYIADQKTVEDEIEARELARIIGEFLDTLTLENRVIFMRRYWFSDSYKDIAEFMGLSEKNISVRLTRIREKMKQYLIEREVFV